jgi:hypothetical protein
MNESVSGQHLSFHFPVPNSLPHPASQILNQFFRPLFPLHILKREISLSPLKLSDPRLSLLLEPGCLTPLFPRLPRKQPLSPSNFLHLLLQGTAIALNPAQLLPNRDRLIVYDLLMGPDSGELLLAVRV